MLGVFFKYLLFVFVASCSLTKNSKVSTTPGVEKKKEAKQKVFKQNWSSSSFKMIELNNIKNNQLNYLYDLNNDGKSDLIFLSETYSTPQYSTKKNAFTDPKSFENINERFSFLSIVDFNGDGNEDFMFSTFYQNSFMTEKGVKVFDHSGNGLLHKKTLHNLKGLPLSAISVFDPMGDGNPLTYFSNWLKFEGGEWRTYLDFFNYNKSFKTLYPHESREKANYGASVCDLNNDEKMELILSSTSGDPIEFLSFNEREKKLEKKILYPNKKVFGIFSECVFFPNKNKPYLVVGNVGHSYQRKKSKSAIYSLDGKTIFTFDLSESFQHKAIKQMDLNGDLYPDFVVENSGFPPHTKLEIYLSNNGEYKKLSGTDIINPSGVVNGDFNGDGRIDLLLGRSGVRMPRNGYNSGVMLLNTIPPKGKSIRFIFGGFKKFLNAQSALLKINFKKSFIKKVVDYQPGGLASGGERYVQIGIGEKRPLSLELYLEGKKRTYKLPQISSGTSIFTICANNKILKGKKACLLE